MKAGTTLLHYIIQQHPDICVARKKEVHFFDNHYERGLNWYAAQFYPGDARRRGEITPNYLYDPRCAARIATHFPNVRIIACVRDPIQRAYSQFKQWVRDTRYPHGFAEFLDGHPNAVARGLYHSQLARYRDYFPSDQIHVLVFEDLISDPPTYLDSTWRYLGVGRPYGVHWPDGPVHETVRPRHRRAYALAKRLRTELYRRDIVWPVELARHLGAGSLFAQSGDGRFPPMTPETVARLQEVYRADVKELGRTLDRNLDDIWTLTAGPVTERHHS
jgi:sulfotransferase family protein